MTPTRNTPDGGQLVPASTPTGQGVRSDVPAHTPWLPIDPDNPPDGMMVDVWVSKPDGTGYRVPDCCRYDAYHKVKTHDLREFRNGMPATYGRPGYCVTHYCVVTGPDGKPVKCP